MHGSGGPLSRNAARRRLQAAQLNRDLGAVLEELEMEASDAGPTSTLLGAVHRCSAMVAVLGALVGGLKPTAQSDGGPDGIYGPNHLGDGAPHILTKMYREWIDQAARVAKLALEAGVEERMIRLVEGQGQMVATLLATIFDDPELALTEDQRQAARTVAARELRALPEAG